MKQQNHGLATTIIRSVMKSELILRIRAPGNEAMCKRFPKRGRLKVDTFGL